ncbi:ankyrin repeat domain-containing protein [Hydrogenophaga sp.]|uniref:ankyrin repeat domain-containing protein n=1 Tax=Hydrogenophaga sp. TaxID=1904254 RepID=UPI003F6F509B
MPHPSLHPPEANAFNDRLRTARDTRDLRQAIWNDDQPAIELMLARGVGNLNEVAIGRTALMEAAALGNDRAVAALLRHGANPNLQDLNGRTARALAAENGHEAVLARLHEPNVTPAPRHWTEIARPGNADVAEAVRREHASRRLSQCMIA